MDTLNTIGKAVGRSFQSLGSIFVPHNQATTTPVAPVAPPKPQVDAAKLAAAIRWNETRGEKNPYGFSRVAGKVSGRANGAYQVTDSELKTYAPRYLGKAVTSQQFLNDPALQDQYMKSKITSLANRGLTPEQILAVHRNGASDLTPTGLSSAISKAPGYVKNGMTQYSTPTPANINASRTLNFSNQ